MGRPGRLAPLKFVRDTYVLPYVKPDHTAVEIGPGGGRWTRYLLGFKSIYAVDYHDEVLREFAKTFGFIQLAQSGYGCVLMNPRPSNEQGLFESVIFLPGKARAGIGPSPVFL